MNGPFSLALRDPDRAEERAAILSGLPQISRVATNAVSIARRFVDDPVIVVLDDDPTGTQPVGDVPVLTRWRTEDLHWALTRGTPLVFILTNTRSLQPAAARERTAAAVEAADEAAGKLGLRLIFVCRGDSTLRGHFPLETEEAHARLSERDGAEGQRAVSAARTLFVPAYLEAGRATVLGEQVIGEGTALRAVDTTEYARDTTFSYSSSYLPAHIAEKAAADMGGQEARLIDLVELRTTSADELVRRISGSAARFVACDALSEDDLARITLLVYGLIAAGERVVLQAGPSLPRVLADLPRPRSLSERSLALGWFFSAGPASGDLIIVGSHVPITTAQLDALLKRRELIGRHVEIQPEELADPEQRRRTVETLVPELVACLSSGERAVISTARTVRAPGNEQENLAFSREVSLGLSELVRRTVELARPRTVIAKGGITSSDIATEALGIHHATVLGPALEGIVSVWRAEDGLCAGLAYVVFAGNVGKADSLVRVVERLETALSGPVEQMEEAL